MKWIKTYEEYYFGDNNVHGETFNFGTRLTKSDIDKVKIFIEDLKVTCEENNIKLTLSSEPGIPYTDNASIIVNGYFDGDGKELACALGKDIDQWLTVLIHESCHMDQFLENTPIWNNNPGMETTDMWLSETDPEVEYDMDDIEKEIKASVDIELDCEKRAVEKIKKYNLESCIDVTEYIQKSNAYVYFYRYMQQSRKWYEIGKEPYNNKDIVSRMPKTFDNDYSTLPKDLFKVFRKYLSI